LPASYRLRENVRKPNISARISKRQKTIANDLKCTADDIARELYKLGFSNMADYMKAGEDRDPSLDFSGLTRDQAAALAEVTVDDFLDGRREDARAGFDPPRPKIGSGHPTDSLGRSRRCSLGARYASFGGFFVGAISSVTH
jgi:hypothetical protein